MYIHDSGVFNRNVHTEERKNRQENSRAVITNIWNAITTNGMPIALRKRENRNTRRTSTGNNEIVYLLLRLHENINY